MKLDQSQLDEYRDQGYLFFPALLSADEMSVLTRALDAIVATPRREIVYEKDGSTVRSIFNMQAYDKAFANLARHPNIVGPVGQMLGTAPYVFQMVLNLKAPFNGDEWPWHQDYPTYRHDDGMARPDVVNTLIFVDEVNEFNSPLMLIPGSHRMEFPLPDIDRSKTSYPARWLPDRYVDTAAKTHGIVAPKGPAGSVILPTPTLCMARAGTTRPGAVHSSR
jgi:ectoine hydroxylase